MTVDTAPRLAAMLSTLDGPELQSLLDEIEKGAAAFAYVEEAFGSCEAFEQARLRHGELRQAVCRRLGVMATTNTSRSLGQRERS